MTPREILEHTVINEHTQYWTDGFSSMYRQTNRYTDSHADVNFQIHNLLGKIIKGF